MGMFTEPFAMLVDGSIVPMGPYEEPDRAKVQATNGIVYDGIVLDGKAVAFIDYMEYNGRLYSVYRAVKDLTPLH